MKTVEDPDVKYLLEEAVEDLDDAHDLGRRAGGRGMGLYHACQAAEKYLRALACAADVPVPVLWSLDRVYAAVAGVAGMDAIAGDARLLEAFSTPAKGASGSVPLPEALRAAVRVRRAVLLALGEDLSDEPAPPEPAPAPEPAVEPAVEAPASPDAEPPDPEVQPIDPMTLVPSQDEPPRERPLPRERWAKGWICPPCGVRLPRTRQTAGGRVPCPHCNRPMVPDR